MKLLIHRTILALLYATGLGAVAYFAIGGLDYYLTPLMERPRHPLYWARKPGGDLGQPFGLVGTTMMILMLGYSLRKRWRPLRRWGPTSMWLDYHIFLGICGPLFVILHSSFKVRGLVALSFWSMIAVASSGVFGRYLYRQIPRTRAGDELSLEEVETLDRKLTRQLTEDFALSPSVVERLEEIARRGFAFDRSLPTLLPAMALDFLSFRLRLWRFRRECTGVSRGLRREFEKAVERKALLRRRLLLWQRLRDLFHYWHVFHKPFAVVMYLFMILHVTVASMTGYGLLGR